MTANAERPTSIRYVIIGVTFLAAFLLYLHRFCISYAQRYVKEDLGLTDEQLGYCFSAFFFAYALGQVPSGWLSDRFGARVTLTCYILIWSFFTAMMGFTAGFAMLLGLRIATGLGQAGAYPTSAGIVKSWIPIPVRGTANACVALGGRLGGGLAPLLTATAIVMFVPSAEPVDFSQDDILDVSAIEKQLIKGLRSDGPHDATPELRVFSRLSHRVQAAVVLDAYVAVPRGIDSLPNSASRLAANRQALVDDLNSILTSRDFYDANAFITLKLEREAKADAEQLANLSDEQLKRFNRLVLEAVFRDGLRKLYGRGWRPVMMLYGSLGLIVAAAFWFVFRRKPSSHPWSNSSEAELIESSEPDKKTDTQPVGGVPIKAIMTSRSLWLICISQWGSNIGWVFLVTWLPLYLFEVHSVPLIERGLMASIPLWVGWIGMILGGLATDRVTRRFGLRWRTLPIVIGRSCAMLAYLACLLGPSAWTVTLLFAGVALFNDFCNPTSWAYKQDVGGRHVASVHGWANMWGNFGATVSPILLQLVISNHGWNAAFGTCAGAFLLSAITAYGVDARIPIVKEESS
ncbi:MAG: hypothetical protein CMJ78_22240 [Planctomycetaceae bacterium]|nr:hypothetical protein [Planctomycetaceae bacterium]